MRGRRAASGLALSPIGAAAGMLSVGPFGRGRGRRAGLIECGVRRREWLGQRVWLALALCCVFAAAVQAYRISERLGAERMRVEANHRLELLAAAVDSIILRLEHIPGTLELNPDLRAWLLAPGDPVLAARVQAFLHALNDQVGARLIYLLDADGRLLAAAGRDTSAAAPGEDLSFRSYFRWARGGLTGRDFSVGEAGEDAGYFVSRPIRDGEEVVGVVAVKIDLGVLQQALEALEEPALIADSNGVVIMSAVSGWRYSALEPMSALAHATARASRLYDDEEIVPFVVPLPLRTGSPPEEATLPALVLTADGAGRLDAARYRVVLKLLERTGWRVVLFSNLRSLRAEAFSHAALVFSAGTVLLMALAYLLQRRRIVRQKLATQALLAEANRVLETTVERRTRSLRETNERLQREVAERKAAEAELRTAQDELVHAARLAALGQLATGITHELSQPLGALSTLNDNAAEYLRRGATDKAARNLELVAEMVGRMDGIITPLRDFARKSPAQPGEVRLSEAVDAALRLVDHRLQKQGVEVVARVPATARVWCDRGRLEQVLVNLFGNAADAMEGCPTRRLTIEIEGVADWPDAIVVSDTGRGLAEGVRARLFEPFFSTKPRGVGLGLGLAISRDIVHEFGGTLSARNGEGGGASFRIGLPPHKEDKA